MRRHTRCALVTGVQTCAHPIFVVLIAGVLPSWAVKIRRLHDQDRSGWWSLATAIPYVGWIATIIIGLLPGTPGENEYGFDPRTDGPDAEETLDRKSTRLNSSH